VQEIAHIADQNESRKSTKRVTENTPVVVLPPPLGLADEIESPTEHEIQKTPGVVLLPGDQIVLRIGKNVL